MARSGGTVSVYGGRPKPDTTSEVPSQRSRLRGFVSEVSSQRFRLRGSVSEVPSQRFRLRGSVSEVITNRRICLSAVPWLNHRDDPHQPPDRHPCPIARPSRRRIARVRSIRQG